VKRGVASGATGKSRHSGIFDANGADRAA
jgi:hypothetical protein